MDNSNHNSYMYLPFPRMIKDVSKQTKVRCSTLWQRLARRRPTATSVFICSLSMLLSIDLEGSPDTSMHVILGLIGWSTSFLLEWQEPKEIDEIASAV